MASLGFVYGLLVGNYGYQTDSNGRSLSDNYKYCVNKSRDMSRDHFAKNLK